MDAERFDDVLRAIAAGTSRRGLVLGLLGAVLGVTLAPGQRSSIARNRKKAKKKPKPNAFGCLNVGQACRGKDRKCCSGICKGKKPKKGKKDQSRCVAHDTGGCRPGQQETFCGGVDVDCPTSAGRNGHCNTTTGNAAYCAEDGDCFPCRTDADCQPFCGPQAACIRCQASCGETDGTACVGPDQCAFLPAIG